MSAVSRKVFLTGATGYMGSRLAPILLSRGHSVTALVRPGSEDRLPANPSLRVHPGDPLAPASLRAALGDCDTWVQLIGTPKPAPWKGARFRAVDLRAVSASAEALPGSSVRHYVYLSVAHPAPLMKAYIAVRMEGESILRGQAATGGAADSPARAPRQTGLALTFLRPWYVLGPGHRWAHLTAPFYKLFEAIPATRAGAQRTGLVTLEQMLGALVHAVENPPDSPSPRILDVPAIRLFR